MFRLCRRWSVRRRRLRWFTQHRRSRSSMRRRLRWLTHRRQRSSMRRRLRWFTQHRRRRSSMRHRRHQPRSTHHRLRQSFGRHRRRLSMRHCAENPDCHPAPSRRRSARVGADGRLRSLALATRRLRFMGKLGKNDWPCRVHGPFRVGSSRGTRRSRMTGVGAKQVAEVDVNRTLQIATVGVAVGGKISDRSA